VAFAAAISWHPHAATAVGEATGEILERLGDSPDVTIAFVSESHLDSVVAIHSTIRGLLGGSLIGAVAPSVIGGQVEAENVPALVLWSAHLEDATPLSLSTADGTVSVIPDVMSEIAERDDLTLILIVDPLSFAIDAALEQLGRDFPKLGVVGGMVSPTTGPGGARLFCDDDVTSSGAVGLLVGNHQVSTIISQGCRPVGNPMVVTAGHANVIEELAGLPALSQLQRLITTLTPDQRLRLDESLHVGRVVDNRLETFGSGDFLISGVLGTDEAAGSLLISNAVAVGDTVQFQLRDTETASDDIQIAFRHVTPAGGALVFTCNGRGSNLFTSQSHDARAISERLGIDAIAGMFCAGEIGPVGPRSFVHGITASVALFAEQSTDNSHHRGG